MLKASRTGASPNASISTAQDHEILIEWQTLSHRERRNLAFPETIKAGRRANPDISLSVLENAEGDVTGKPVFLQIVVRAVAPLPHIVRSQGVYVSDPAKAIAERRNPQSAVAIE